jgi:ABC-2 type transport system permease protein
MMYPFADVSIYNIYIILIFAIIASAIMSLIGTISGIWAEKWDHLGTVGNFVIVPLSFLSGTFYSITVLPGPVQTASLINPFFYMIDGFRYGFLGVSDSSYLSAIFILLVIFIFLLAINYLMLKSGYKLRP